MGGWDGFFNDMDSAIQRDKYQAKFNEYDAAIANLERQLESDREYAASIVGVRAALAIQLERHDPTNPVLRDNSLIERIKKAAISAFKIAGLDYAAARDVGSTFRIPGREGPVAVLSAPKELVKPPTLLKNDAADEMRMAYAGMLALRTALATQLKKVDPDNPLLNDLMLEERIRKAGRAAYAISSDDFNAAREVGKTFQIPGRG